MIGGPSTRRLRIAAHEAESGAILSYVVTVEDVTQLGLAADVGDALAGAPVEPSALCLEVTESILMNDSPYIVHAVQEVRAQGVKLVIDDFGTGLSSLARLKKLPVDVLKIDRSFVDGLGKDGDDEAIVEAVVKLGHLLGLTIVAEGVGVSALTPRTVADELNGAMAPLPPRAGVGSAHRDVPGGCAPRRRDQWRSRALRAHRSRLLSCTIFQRRATSGGKQAESREEARRGPSWDIGGSTSAGMMP